MKQKKGKKITRKHIWSVILVIALFLTSFGMPGMTQKVHGQETRVIEAPSSASYITNVVEGEGFKASNFNSIYNKDKKLWQKVNFGKNDMEAQRWNIVGENEDGSLVLLCDMGQPICGGQPFNSSAEDIEDLNRIKGDYIGDKPQSVYANHYGSSELRIYLQSLTEGTANEKFSVAEQKLMQDATVRCYDMKNSRSYTVTDKLYVPDGEYEGEYTTLKVGDNDKFELNTLFMGPAVTKFNPMEKWLRTPMKMPGSVGSLYMMHRLSYYFVYGVNLAGYVAPVFHMDLSSVLFASSAQEATSNAGIDLNAMSFRYRAQDQISSTATYNEKGITISNAGNDEYLYIQWKEGEEEKVYSCKATNGTVFAQTIGGEGFELTYNCRIWLEKKDKTENLDYAKFVEYKEDTVLIKKEQTISSNNVTVQLGVNNKIVQAKNDKADGGELRYSVTNGTDIIGINAATGEITTKKVGTATVTITALETAIYLPATRDVKVTVTEVAANKETGTEGTPNKETGAEGTPNKETGAEGTPNNVTGTGDVPKKLKLEDVGPTYTQGKYIYYAYEFQGLRTGIVRYDTKTKKRKTIVSYKRNGDGTNGFDHINVTDKYIVACWDQFYGTDTKRRYIYRFSKDGKKKKKLAVGYNPIVVGDYIYFERGTVKSYMIYRMKLDGTGMKRVKQIKQGVVDLFKDGKNLYYSVVKERDTDNDITVYDYYNLKGKKYEESQVTLTNTLYEWGRLGEKYAITQNGYKYYLDTRKETYGPKTLYRKEIGTGNVEILATFDSGIKTASLCGNYIMVRGVKSVKPRKYYLPEKGFVYVMKLSGEDKKCLLNWWIGE